MAISKTKPSKSRVKPKAGASAKALKTKTAQTELPKTLTTRVFKSGNSQAVRIPKEFQFEVEEVEGYLLRFSQYLGSRPLE